MNLKKKIQTIWNNKEQILEGMKNTMFKNQMVEEIAQHRMQICQQCSLYTMQNEGCVVAGTTPCCDERMGGCGCSLAIKTRSLSSSCPLSPPKWEAVLSQEEEDQLNANP